MATDLTPTIGRIVRYRTDGRNGIAYDLPAMIVCTEDSHAGDYPDGSKNPLSVPPTSKDGSVHLVVFTPGDGQHSATSYAEHNVPEATDYDSPENRSWRWPQLT